MVQVTKIQTSGYESVDRVQDSRSGLDGFIAVHSTVRGPALGGLRFRRYRDLDEALADALRLSEAMTYKAAAGLPFGGGKAVVIGDPQSDNAAGLLTESVIPDLRCRAVVGSANNQLRSDDVSDQLADRGIAYVPDFIANAGGSSTSPRSTDTATRTFRKALIGLQKRRNAFCGTAIPLGNRPTSLPSVLHRRRSAAIEECIQNREHTAVDSKALEPAIRASPRLSRVRRAASSL
ncbi:MAG: hypothetical protein IIB04_02840 [Acidobacteria bacterium]|nr:hypothetical protein [Acidobacteriota bacterium]MCH8985533.1 hypothetical protein [Acidobacteriota bacterium]